MGVSGTGTGSGTAGTPEVAGFRRGIWRGGERHRHIVGVILDDHFLIPLRQRLSRASASRVALPSPAFCPAGIRGGRGIRVRQHSHVRVSRLDTQSACFPRIIRSGRITQPEDSGANQIVEIHLYRQMVVHPYRDRVDQRQMVEQCFSGPCSSSEPIHCPSPSSSFCPNHKATLASAGYVLPFPVALRLTASFSSSV